jgi:hypothetical protein
MANLNLSEFTEKLFVADADHTFIWDTVGAISKRVSRNSWLNSGTLTSDAPVTISQTWNNAAVAFTGLKVVATETATAATASNLLELWAGSTPALKLSVSKGGNITSKVGIITASGTSNASGLSLELLFAGYGLGIDANGNTAFFLNGVAKTRCGFGVAVSSDQSIGWTNTTHVGSNATPDTILLRDAANTLALRNGANAQTFNVYGTWTTAITNFERLAIKYNATDVAYQIAAEKGTTNGDYRPLQLWTGGAKRLIISAAGAVIERPLSSVTPADNGDLVVEATSNTTLTFKLKGTDGTVRSGTITLSV